MNDTRSLFTDKFPIKIDIRFSRRCVEQMERIQRTNLHTFQLQMNLVE